MRPRRTLQRRLRSLILRVIGVLIPALLVVVSFAYSHLRTDATNERLLLARTVAHHFDAETESALRSLGRLAANLPSLDAAAVPRMRDFRFQSDYREAIYVLDGEGQIVVADPETVQPLPRDLLPEHEKVTSRLRKAGVAHSTLAMIEPFRRDGQPYFLVSEMNPVGSPLSTFLHELGTNQDLHVVLLDETGEIIAAPDQQQLFQNVVVPPDFSATIRAHRSSVFEAADCSVVDRDHERGEFLNVVVPLRFAPWAVLVQQETDKAFTTLSTARTALLSGAVLIAVFGIVLARALSRSLVTPIEALSVQAERLQRGELDRPITVEGDHEIVVLGTTLDAARRRLAETLEELRALNESLERQVANRTRRLQEQYENLRLLNGVLRVSTQEPLPDKFLPQILQLMADRFGFPAIGVVTLPVAEYRGARYTFPADAHLPWISASGQPPPGWQVRELTYQETRHGRLFHPSLAREPDELMEALAAQLALSLHGAVSVQRAIVQDQQRRALVRRMLTAGEEERKRIARELHDEISQLLTVVQLSIDETGIDSPAVQKAKRLLLRTQKEVHRIIYDLRPSLLDDLGLAAAVRSHAASYLADKGIEVNLEIQEGLRLPPETEITAFRIYQEIVTNILRHAGADSVSVELYTDHNDVVLAVEDDGTGFDPEQGTGGGAGLLGMRERAALVGGTIVVNTEPGLGTQVTVRMPLHP
jgi:signal transduction histidine kinase